MEAINIIAWTFAVGGIGFIVWLGWFLMKTDQPSRMLKEDAESDYELGINYVDRVFSQHTYPAALVIVQRKLELLETMQNSNVENSEYYKALSIRLEYKIRGSETKLDK